jgi:energy-coupling factor transporter transmembrane protein EcfT
VEIIVKGMAGLVIIGATLATMTLSSLHSGLSTLPIPRLFRSLTLQILQQAAILVEQTRRIAQAVAVRGGEMNMRDTLFLIRSFPSVWLLRLAYKSERVADAMEVRQYPGADVPGSRKTWTALDRLVCLASAVLAVLALLVRFGARL